MNPVAPEQVHQSPKLSAKAEQFTESVIREMTRLAMQHNAVNLAQGFPDFRAPAEIKEAPRAGHRRRHQSVRHHLGREAVARRHRRAIRSARTACSVDPEREITVCCGSTEAMMAAMMAHHQSRRRSGDLRAVLRELRTRRDSFRRHAALRADCGRRIGRFDPDELARAFGPKTKAIIVNTPNNPTGKVFTRAELELIRDLCVQWNAFADHRRNLRAHYLRRREAHLDGLARRHARPHHHHQRHVQDLQRHRLARGLGHRSAGSSRSAIRKVHDFLTVGAAAPLQDAGAVALRLAGELLPAARRRLPREARPHAGDPRAGAGFRCFKPAARTTS